MAKRRVPQFLGLQQSLFRPSKAVKSKLPSLVVEDESATAREKINAAFCAFVMQKCASVRRTSGRDIAPAVSVIRGRPVAEWEAWEWMLAQFLSANSHFCTLEYQPVIERAKMRVRKMKRHVRHKIAIERINREAGEARKQYAEERKANGGEATFYDSNKWQRLRYQVLAASNGRCELCGRSTREHGVIMHVDHIKPRSRFPNLSLVRSNLQVLCEDCNFGKGNRDTTDWRPTLVIDNGKTKIA